MVDGSAKPTVIPQLTKQVEFYLSDDNLKKDKFFNELMKEKKGLVPLDVIMKCNKIKVLTQDMAQLIEALKSSTKLEVNDTEKTVSRKGSPPIPDLGMAGKRKGKEEEEKGGAEFLKDEDLNNPIILGIAGPEEAKSNWREMETIYKQLYPDRKVLYSRYDKGHGHIGISSSKVDVAKVSEEVKLKVGAEEFVIKKLEAPELEKFWGEHGTHFNLCTNKKLSLSKLKKKKAEREKRNPQISVTLGDFTYDDINKVKSKARVILNLKKNGDVLDEVEKKFVVDLLKYHSKAADKLKDMKDIIVDDHPTYEKTRCFLVVRKDGTKEDFSIAKCIENMKEKAKSA